MKSYYSLALLIILSGVAGCVDESRGGRAYVAPSIQITPNIVGQDDYVYYPRYQMYYGSRTHQYYYQEGSSWAARPEPRGLSAGVVTSSPSVRVEFHDHPAAHHAEVSRTYPKSWKGPGGDQGRKEDQREDNRK